jgi:Mce-associated membrane protein
VTLTADHDCSSNDEIETPPDDEREPCADTDVQDANGRTWRWKRHGRSAVVIAVFAGAFALAGGLGWKLWDEHAVDQAGQAAQRTAIDYAQVLTSIDSGQVDQNFSAVLNGATGDFKETYTKASAQLRQLLIDNKAAAHGTVVDSAIQSQTKSKVVVLLMVDQTVSNAVRPDGRVDRSRMKITMENVGGRWLASKVELP